MSMKENANPLVVDETVVEDPVKKPTKAQRIAGTIVNVVLVIAIILAVLATYVSYATTNGSVPSVFGLRLYSVQTNSMEPTLMQGDLVFSTAVKDVKTLQRGDVITYWTTIDNQRVLNTHRIVEIAPISGGLGFITKGDYNTSNDPYYVHQRDIVGKVPTTGENKYARLSGVGKVFDYLQTSTGFLLVVVIPVLIFLLVQLVQFFRVLFEYQNVKNRIKFEQERGRTEDLIAEQELKKAAERERIEAELREKLRAELMAEQNAATAETPETDA